jgi:hypothetical protein
LCQSNETRGGKRETREKRDVFGLMRKEAEFWGVRLGMLYLGDPGISLRQDPLY